MSDQQKITEFSQSAEQSDSVESNEEPDEFGWGSFGKPPEDWPVSRVEELFEIQKDSADPEKLDEGELVRLYSMPAFDEGKKPELIKADDIGSKKFHVPNQTLLFSKLNISKKRFWLVNHSHDEPALCSTEYWPLLPADGLNLEFYLQYFNSDSFIDRPRLSTSSTTNSHQRIKSNLFDKVRLPVPPLPEQRKIATVLYTVDRAIEKTDTIVKQTHQVKSGLMQDVFHGKHESHQKYISTPVGDIPSHWEVASIGDVVHTAQYGISESLSEEGQYPIFRMNNIENGYMIEEPMKYIDLEDGEFEKYQVEEGDILFNRTNSLELVGKTGIYELEGDHVFASYLVRLQANEKVDPYYLNYYMNSSEAQNRMMDFATKGVSQANINANSIQQVKLPLPPLEEQEQIVKQIRSIDDQIESNERYKSQLQRLKKGLRQDLLSGKVRTTDTNIEVPDEIAQHG
ncbi:restriction endonuclease subunit S [Halalkaliarchaeum sp. AArc-GB]|uniref:restriction endonuclease subunit S n=1 Tax=Halalkaliarchaeum sp. AArc-GB TaxID=3074078 RepID=UPI0028583D7B|nr:restriction endonuclease subunit S [Halalkaliarchaeum sp. AArc-GB]MDR5674650.1 restriction endonuclease subunit S [Halalkaliarchaeum sp. AArc-GB]